VQEAVASVASCRQPDSHIAWPEYLCSLLGHFLEIVLAFPLPLWYNTDMENTKRTQRTPAEIIAETEARLERLRLRQAKAEAQTNPAVASLMDTKADLAKEVREAKKLLGDGPQSANARIEKHEAWISKIEAERFAAEDVLVEAESSLESVNAEIAEAIQGIVETSKEISIEA